MAKKQTQIQIEYKKQVKRLKQAVRRAEKRGYIVPENIIPKHPKRITKKSVERLKKITPEKIYEKAERLDYETGELIPGIAARKQERSEAAKKAAQTRAAKKTVKKDVRFDAEKGEAVPYTPDYKKFPTGAKQIISNFRAEMTRFPEVAQPIAMDWLNRIIRDYGEEDVAKMLEECAAIGLGIDYTIAYREDLILNRLEEMMKLLPDASEGNIKAIVEALEYHETWEYPD